MVRVTFLRGRESRGASLRRAERVLVLTVRGGWPILRTSYSRSVECVARHNAFSPVPLAAAGRALPLSRRLLLHLLLLEDT